MESGVSRFMKKRRRSLSGWSFQKLNSPGMSLTSPILPSKLTMMPGMKGARLEVCITSAGSSPTWNASGHFCSLVFSPVGVKLTVLSIRKWPGYWGVCATQNIVLVGVRTSMYWVPL